MIEIRRITPQDKEEIWKIIHEVISAGDTYVFAPDSTREEMLAFWYADDKYAYVAVDNDQVVGTFFMKNNQPGLGSHVANAGYMVPASAAGKGIGKSMCLFSMSEARRLGYHAMQFNIVVKSNQRAVQLWQKLGFEIVGEVPEAFNHRTLGLTGIYIMYQKL